MSNQNQNMRGERTVEVSTEIRGVSVVAHVVGSECRAEPDVGIMSGYFDPSHVESIEPDGEEACGLLPLSEEEESTLLELAQEQWEPEEWDDHDAAYDSWREGDQ